MMEISNSMIYMFLKNDAWRITEPVQEISWIRIDTWSISWVQVLKCLGPTNAIVKQ